MLTKEQIAAIKADIELAARAAGPFVALLGPQGVAGLVIGQAIAKQVPELVAIVQAWVTKAEPTAEEKSDLASKLAVLQNPDLP